MSILSKLKIKPSAPRRDKKPNFLEGIMVQDQFKNWIKLNSLWRNQPVILKVLRRLGCPLCRYESKLLSELKPVFEELGIALAAVTFDEVGLDDFLAGSFWGWELLLDTERATYKALGLGRHTLLESISDLLSPSGRKAIRNSREAGIYGDLKGDGFQLGGTFIITPDEGLIYSYIQRGASLYPCLKEVCAVVGVDSDTVDDLNFANFKEISQSVPNLSFKSHSKH